MNKILIVTHSTLAEGFYNSVKLLTGNVGNLSFINAFVDDSDWTESLEDFFKDYDKNATYIIFDDLYGGSVNQKLVQYKNKHKFILICGINLPVVLTVSLAPNTLTLEEINQIVRDCQSELKIVSLEHVDNTNEDDFFD